MKTKAKRSEKCRGLEMSTLSPHWSLRRNLLACGQRSLSLWRKQGNLKVECWRKAKWHFHGSSRKQIGKLNIKFRFVEILIIRGLTLGFLEAWSIHSRMHACAWICSWDQTTALLFSNCALQWCVQKPACHRVNSTCCAARNTVLAHLLRISWGLSEGRAVFLSLSMGGHDGDLAQELLVLMLPEMDSNGGLFWLFCFAY